ncbi:hypothetical protein CTI14_70060, partial [Methylobacterium radiotolerans]
GLLLGLFVYFHSAGPGAQGMTMATLSYPTLPARHRRRLRTSSGLLLGLFVYFHSAGPGAQGMTMATLSYPTLPAR